MTAVLIVSPRGDAWGVSVDGEVMAVAGSEPDAQRLAEDAAKVLRESGEHARVLTYEVAPRERRSFEPEE